MENKPESEGEKLMQGISDIMESKLGSKNSLVSISNDAKLIEYKKEPKTAKQEKTSVTPETVAILKIENLIQTCGERKIDDRINQLEELFAEHPKLLTDDDIINILKGTYINNKNKWISGIKTNAEKESLKIGKKELEEIRDCFFKNVKLEE